MKWLSWRFSVVSEVWSGEGSWSLELKPTAKDDKIKFSHGRSLANEGSGSSSGPTFDRTAHTRKRVSMLI